MRVHVCVTSGHRIAAAFGRWTMWTSHWGSAPMEATRVSRPLNSSLDVSHSVARRVKKQEVMCNTSQGATAWLALSQAAKYAGLISSLEVCRHADYCMSKLQARLMLS